MSCLKTVGFLKKQNVFHASLFCENHWNSERRREEQVSSMETLTPMELVLAAQTGDRAAFEILVQPYQRELLVHCYRMVGSFHDAKDLVQETLLRAWEKRSTFSYPGSYRAWLYRIATNLCLNVLKRNKKRSLPPSTIPKSDPARPLPESQPEPSWLEPFPDELLADPQSDPETRALQREQTTLAFLTALQYLTPAQRAILLLREVLDWEVREVAEWLNLSVAAVNSSLQRARRALQHHYVSPQAPVSLSSPQLQALLQRHVRLWEQGDAWLTMPPIPVWFKGRTAIEIFFRTTIFLGSRRWRLYPTWANAGPAFGLYEWRVQTRTYQLAGLLVLLIVGEQIANTVVFLDPSSFSSFMLPPDLSP
jgi:RNA polymerase sigma-70 factor, ECF subfamily